MKRKALSVKLIMIVFTSAVIAFASCKKKEKTPDESSTPNAVTINYAIANVGGAFPNQTTYIQGLKDLSASNLDNSNASESSSFASMWSYNGAVYLTAFGAPATAVKYTFDENGKAVVSGKLIVPGANTFSSLEFVSATEAYASVGGGLARVVKFNPTTFQVTGEVKLNTIQKPAAASVYYLGMKARNGKLFMGVRYFDANFTDLVDSAFVAVIDLATSKVEKLIADGRTSAIFAAGSSINSIVQDDNGDLYIQGMGSGNKPSGILRIKNGETNFDNSYFFDLKASTGKDCSGLYHFGNGLTFTTQIQDPSDPYEMNGPNYKYVRIDLAAKTSSGIIGGVPAIFGSSTSIMRKFDNTSILFVVSTNTENAIYNYDINSGVSTKKIKLNNGVCTGFNQLN